MVSQILFFNKSNFNVWLSFPLQERIIQHEFANSIIHLSRLFNKNPHEILGFGVDENLLSLDLYVNACFSCFGRSWWHPDGRLASPWSHSFVSCTSSVFMITLRSVNCWCLIELGLSCSRETQDLFSSGFLFKESQLWGVTNKLKHTSMLSSNEQQEEQKSRSSYRVWSLRRKLGGMILNLELPLPVAKKKGYNRSK